MTAQPAHTPGPWRLIKGGIIKRDNSPISDDGEILGSASGLDNSGFFAPVAEAEANGRLMAAAPDLLDALQFAIRFFDQITPADAERLRLVVAKATGSAA